MYEERPGEARMGTAGSLLKAKRAVYRQLSQWPEKRDRTCYPSLRLSAPLSERLRMRHPASHGFFTSLRCVQN